MTDRMVHRQVVYRLLPRTRGRWRRLERLLEAQRQLYNAALEERIDCWRKAGRSVSWQDQFRSLTVCRREIPEMAADPVAVQRGTPDQVRGRLLKRLDEAYRAFFRRVKSGEAPGFPRFRSRRRWDSLSVVSGVRLDGTRLRVPGFGWLTVRRRGGNPYPEGAPVSAPGVARLFHAPDTARLEARAKRLSRRLARQNAAAGAGSAAGCVWRGRVGASPGSAATGGTGPAGPSPAWPTPSRSRSCG